ncbi:hypothetical protein QQF64_001799 [Cirrhinus molitorella]|uniref:Uncharacterized protein n=1 Tax=Cirrhinus molitorella TaxID=172907 RepID=A0ABR3MNE1_9TELE
MPGAHDWDEVADKHEEEMTTLSSLIVCVFLLGLPCSSRSESCVAGNVSLSVSVSNNSTLLVDWNSGSKQTTQCALLISTQGRQEIQIHLLPRSGSLLLENMTNYGKHSFLCSCFEQSQGLLCSKNLTFVIGEVATPPLVPMSNTQSSASNISMKWLSSANQNRSLTVNHLPRVIPLAETSLEGGMMLNERSIMNLPHLVSPLDGKMDISAAAKP